MKHTQLRIEHPFPRGHTSTIRCCAGFFPKHDVRRNCENSGFSGSTVHPITCNNCDAQMQHATCSSQYATWLPCNRQVQNATCDVQRPAWKMQDATHSRHQQTTQTRDTRHPVSTDCIIALHGRDHRLDHRLPLLRLVGERVPQPVHPIVPKGHMTSFRSGK
jgi:hypothetical protein